MYRSSTTGLDARKKGEPGELKMPAEFVKAACDEAHRLGLPVAAHVESPEGVKVALRNGVDTIEHGAEPDQQPGCRHESVGAPRRTVARADHRQRADENPS